MRFIILLVVLCACGFDEEKKTENLTDPPGFTIPIGDILPKPEPKPAPDSETKPEPSNKMPNLIPCRNPKSWRDEGVRFKGCVESKRVLLILNGTNSPCSFQRRVIDHASNRGYLTACPATGWTGTGEQGARAVEYLQRVGVDVQYVAISGFSQGGGGVIGTSRILMKKQPKLRTDIIAMMPYVGFSPYWEDRAPKLPGRKIVVCGTRDTTVPCNGVEYLYRLFNGRKEFVYAPTSHLFPGPQRFWIEQIDKLDD